MQRTTVGLIILVALALLGAPHAAHTQPPTNVHRIGWLDAGPPLLEPNLSSEVFRQSLHDLGYVEGQNLVMEYRYAEGTAEQLPDLATDLVRLKVDVIVAGGTAAVRAAQHATRTIPIVMAAISDPVGEGFVASLAQPGGNITGLSFLAAELPGKRLQFLKETVPQSTRIAVLVNPAWPAFEARMSNLTMAAQALGLHLHVVEVRRADELDTAFAALTQAGADAIIVMEEPQVIDHLRRRIADLAATHRLPTMYSWKSSVDAGGLMAYGPSQPDMLRRAASYVDKILKGAKPADLPVEQPTKFKLVINLKTAQALSLTIPPAILFQADEVIR
jgi:putative tryptophan/tyrosine transport system substrate-binding protein